MAQAVSINHVTKSFFSGRAHLPVLESLSLTAQPGEIVALLGPSGCGKSTILRLVGGLEAPTGGRVEIGTRPVTTTDPRCSIVFQEPRLLPWRSVADNVALGAERRRDSQVERGREVVDRLLARVGLGDCAGLYSHQLSGGMAQRVALARGLAAEPEVLLLDEPFAALDALTRLSMQDLLIEAWSDRKPTVLLVTHDVDEAIYLADRIVVLGGSRPASVIAQIGVPAERPRDHADPAFLAIRAQILGHLGFTHRGAAEDRSPAAVHAAD
ncbi:MAG TPA: ABC transporter ATP-binding protein [Thermomicrobiales bacterium]|nr:ABC transporter ATP-binding protein [Thermomicrobiales bacterium]